MVYAILYTKDSNGVLRTWKYGISTNGASPPQSQVNVLNRMGRPYRMFFTWNTIGWYRNRWEAERIEWALIMIYYMRHGHCPPGQFFSCR